MAIAIARDVLGDVLRLIESTLKVPADRIDVDASMESFGVNSLIAMELMANIQSEFEVVLTPADFAGVDTTRDLAGLLASLIEDAGTESARPAATGLQPWDVAAGSLLVTEAVASNPSFSTLTSLVAQ